MKKKKQWQKPELSVLARSKSEKTAELTRIDRAQYYSEPGPSAHYGGMMRSRGTEGYLGPAPAPAPPYVGPAPAPFFFGTHKSRRK